MEAEHDQRYEGAELMTPWQTAIRNGICDYCKAETRCGILSFPETGNEYHICKPCFENLPGDF